MDLVCKETFGNFKPGDTVTVPDDAVYDGAYFKPAETDAKPADNASDSPKDVK